MGMGLIFKRSPHTAKTSCSTCRVNDYQAGTARTNGVRKLSGIMEDVAKLLMNGRVALGCVG